jgi:hypothetical protein
MKKIPTIFDRDWNGDRSRVVNIINGAADWVFAGEGVATMKLDGTSCLMLGGQLFKRRELRAGEGSPDGFVQVDFDETTGKIVGWVPVGDGPEDRWHREALALYDGIGLGDGTYELIGPKVQGNPEGAETHQLVAHDSPALLIGTQPERSFEAIREYLSNRDIEGIVFHHPDGRMAKIKGRDFGLKRTK